MQYIKSTGGWTLNKKMLFCFLFLFLEEDVSDVTSVSSVQTEGHFPSFQWLDHLTNTEKIFFCVNLSEIHVTLIRSDPPCGQSNYLLSCGQREKNLPEGSRTTQSPLCLQNGLVL